MQERYNSEHLHKIRVALLSSARIIDSTWAELVLSPYLVAEIRQIKTKNSERTLRQSADRTFTNMGRITDMSIHGRPLGEINKQSGTLEMPQTPVVRIMLQHEEM